MQTDCTPSVEYPCLDCECAAEAHEVHPFFDRPSWQEGFARGYEEGRVDGEHLAAQALRSELLYQLQVMESDVRLGLRHDLETPHAVLQAVTWLIEERK